MFTRIKQQLNNVGGVSFRKVVVGVARAVCAGIYNGVGAGRVGIAVEKGPAAAAAIGTRRTRGPRGAFRRNVG